MCLENQDNCETLCERYNFTRFSDFYEGDIKQIYKVYNKLITSEWFKITNVSFN